MVGSHSSGGETHVKYSHFQMGIFVLWIAQKVAKSLDSITRQSCGELQPGGFSVTATIAN